MNRFLRRFSVIVVVVPCILLALASAGATFAEAIPLEAFAGLPQVSSVTLSPSGKYLAVLRNQDGESLLTTQLASGADPHVVVRSDNSEYFIQWHQWVNDERLLVGIRFGATTRNKVESIETRLMAVNRDGTDAKESLITLGRRQSIFGGDHYSQRQDRVIAVLPDDPKHVLIELDKNNQNIPHVYQLNVYSGHLTLVQANPGNAEGIGAIRQWLADRQGRVRVGIGLRNNQVRVMVRPLNAENFEELVEFDWTKERGTIPLGFDHDPNLLYVRAVYEGRWAIFRVDLRKAGKPRELLAADAEYDIEGGLIYSRGLRAVVGVSYSADQARTLYWDKRVQQIPSRVNAALPGRRNVIISSTDDNRRHVVLSTGPSHPPHFYIFDREHDRIVRLTNMYPALPADEMRTPETVVIRARDGLQLHGYLTTPTAREPRSLPLIMFPHGGPWARDTAHFDPWVQFFVNRGWAVLQVNFRGSKGYGETFERAGFQRWGLAMQDDLTDSARWAIEQGLADANRICIVGASYGGYAALMGAIKTPELYRCAISIAGVSDLRRLVNDWRFYLDGAIAAETTLGHWWLDRDRLNETSPIVQAAKIRTPVLLLHGTADVIVPVAHSREMAEALKKAGHTDFRYVEMPMADHWLSRQPDRIETFREMEMFLRAHLS